MSSVEAVYIFVTDVVSVVWFNMVLKRYKKFIKKKKKKKIGIEKFQVQTLSPLFISYSIN
jgi:hypothetical protein